MNGQRPRGRKLVTLQDAAQFILKLSKTEQSKPHWQAAAQAVMIAAEDRGPLMHADVGMKRTLNAGKPVEFDPKQKCPHWSFPACLPVPHSASLRGALHDTILLYVEQQLALLAIGTGRIFALFLRSTPSGSEPEHPVEDPPCASAVRRL